MHPILSTGLTIGVLCGLWTFAMGFTGWYKDPGKVNRFFVVILIEIAGLIWGLRKTAAQGRTYSGQVVAGGLMAIVAGVVIMGFSMIFTTVLFPGYFEELVVLQGEQLRQAGKPEAEIRFALDAAAPFRTPLMNAAVGFLGTFMTGVVVSAVVGIWIRARGPRVGAARV